MLHPVFFLDSWWGKVSEELQSSRKIETGQLVINLEGGQDLDLFLVCLLIANGSPKIKSIKSSH